jgi:hypothetical protein
MNWNVAQGWRWMNPPYGREIGKWVKKASEEKYTVCLLPARTDTKYFHKYIYNKPGVEIRFLKDQQKELDLLVEKNKELETQLELAVGLKDIEPFKIEYRESKNDSEATAFMVASDWHIEETVEAKTINGLNNYNLFIAKERAKQFFQNGVKLLKKEQQNAKIKNLVLALIGDFISGNIHEELLESCSLRPAEASIEATNYIISGIQYILDNTDVNIIIPCHVGNHSRITKKIHVSTEKGNSLETIMYYFMKNHFKGNKRVEFLISESYLSYLNVNGFVVCFQHGHAIKFGGGVGGLTIPVNKAIAQWEKMKRADLYVFGHFHTFLDGGNFICNGSNIGYNSYAVMIKASYEQPKQSFFLIDHKRNCKTVVCPILYNI